MQTPRDFPTRDAALEWLYDTVDDPYIDNTRFAFVGDAIAVRKFDAQSAEGCCGCAEFIVKVAGRPAWVGCNYGH